MTATFPGATADRESAAYVMVGAPLDRTTTFRAGTRAGPDQLRRFARPFEDYDPATGQLFSELQVHDHGDVHPFDDQETYLGYLEGVLAEVYADGAVPVTLGGEHTVSVAGIRAVQPDIVVSIDAHLDLRDRFHGSKYNHACVMARAREVVQEIYIIGARSGSQQEWDQAGNADITVVPPAEVSDWSMPQSENTVYLTVDIDAVDPSAAPGTGTMEPFGLQPRELRRLLRELAPQAAGFDVVEVNGRDSGQTAALGAKTLRRCIYDHATT